MFGGDSDELPTLCGRSLKDFGMLFLRLGQKIRTVELDGKTIKLQIVSDSFHVL